MSSSTTSISAELSVFADVTQQSPPECNDFKICICIRGLLTASKYCSKFKIQINESDQEIFTNFTNEVYNHQILIEDFNHFQKQHDHQLNDMMSYVFDNEIYPNCNIDSCDHSTRHYRIQNDENISKIMDHRIKLYQDTLDSFHFYLMHLHRVGLRCIGPNQVSGQDEVDDESKHEESYDPELHELAVL